jgi:Rod binding domain-containing protein
MKNQLIEALNRLDELASRASSDDVAEAEQQAKDYDLLFSLLSSLDCDQSA